MPERTVLEAMNLRRVIGLAPSASVYDAAFLMRRNRWPGMGLSQDGTNYFDVHHTVHDTLDRIDPATLPQNVACWAVTSWLAAQAPLAFGPPVL